MYSVAFNKSSYTEKERTEHETKSTEWPNQKRGVSEEQNKRLVN